MFLDAVIQEKKSIVKNKKSSNPAAELKKRLDAYDKRPFLALFQERFCAEARIIAELKKASPSRGLLRPDFDLTRLVNAYESGGATALSVLTEEHYFHGSLDYLPACRNLTALPLLRKDFIVDEYELYEAKSYGADAVLLIAEALEKHQIAEYLACAKDIELDILIEVHSMKAYEKIAGYRGYLLGINNRNLFTLKTDTATAAEMLGRIPLDQPVIVESGIEERGAIERFLSLGASGFLIGTALVLSDDPVRTLNTLRGKDR